MDKMAVYTYPVTIRFQHCDPAGIVFYPRYFEMFNLVIETWFETSLDHGFKKMHYVSKFGIPTVNIETGFHAPSFLEDIIDFQLIIKHLGISSVTLQIEGKCGAEMRCTDTQTIVCVDMETRKPRPWPDQVRAQMVKFQET
jgi:4-hydroxybenzoyl-CoA thioesterase